MKPAKKQTALCWVLGSNKGTDDRCLRLGTYTRLTGFIKAKAAVSAGVLVHSLTGDSPCCDAEPKICLERTMSAALETFSALLYLLTD